MAARPRTLPAALAPVFVGTAAAYHALQGGVEIGVTIDGVGDIPVIGAVIIAGTDYFRWGTFIAALIGAIFIQIGTNLANDYSDAKRGADTADRLGPVRVTASGLARPAGCCGATWAAFGVAALAGLYLGYRGRRGDRRRRR